MLKQAENIVKIEGILAEINIEPGSFVKNGETKEVLRGTIDVKVIQKFGESERELIVPVHVFSSKYTNSGSINPSYDSLLKVKETFVSIAAAGEDAADRVRITSGKLAMNEFHNKTTGNLVSYPRVTASFINKIAKEQCKPEATFTAQFTVVDKQPEFASDGTETGRYKVFAALPQYGGKVDLFTLFAEAPGVINGVSTYWENGSTVKANGKLNFTSKTETVLTEVDFGEPTEKTYTRNVSELIITGGSQTPLEGDFAFDINEIKQGLADRKARLDAQKNSDMSISKQKLAPAPTSSNMMADLGF